MVTLTMLLLPAYNVATRDALTGIQGKHSRKLNARMDMKLNALARTMQIIEINAWTASMKKFMEKSMSETMNLNRVDEYKGTPRRREPV